MNKGMIAGALSLALFSSQFSPIYGMQAEEEKAQQEAPKKSKRCNSQQVTHYKKFTLLLAVFAALLSIPVEQAYTEVQNTKIAPYYGYDGLGGKDGAHLLPFVEGICQGKYKVISCDWEIDNKKHYDMSMPLYNMLDPEEVIIEQTKQMDATNGSDENGRRAAASEKIISLMCEKEKQIKTEQCMRNFKIGEDGLSSQVDEADIFIDEAHTQLTMWAKLRHWACKKAQEDIWFGAFLKMWTNW